MGILFGMLTWLSPKTLVAPCSALGNEGLALWYSERAYEKSKDDNDLRDLLYRANRQNDFEKVAKYSPTYLLSPLYQAETKENQDYFAGEYAVAFYAQTKDVSSVCVFADSYIGAQGYFKDNPYQYLIYSFAKGRCSCDSNGLTQFKAKLQSILAGTTDGATMTRINTDVSLINNLLGE